ncbi:SusC/RagA family TonB-linked outer membrane protein [Bacteroides congonensis]
MKKKVRSTKSRILLLLTLFLILSVEVFAQGVTVKGKVTDSEGEPIIGATVKEKDKKAGIITDLEGEFSLKVSSKFAKLEISYIGMKSVIVPAGSGASLKIVLEEDNKMLDEVVVVGYGTSRRGDLTGAISSIDEKALRDVPLTSAAAAITGKLAGVNVVTTDGSPDAQIQITVRGGGSITQDNSPLIIIDGFQANNLNDIPPGDIANVTVLKDASSTAIYGAKGANGVILVTTKSGKIGKTEVSFNAHWGFSHVYNMTRVLSPYEYYYFQKELDPTASLSAGINSMYGRWDDRNIYRSVEGTDWQDIMYGDTGFKQNYNVSINGGVESVRYNISYTRDNEDYIMVNSDFIRDNLNLRFNKDFSKKLKFELSSRLTKTLIIGDGTNGGKLKDAIRFSPISSMTNMDEDDLGTDADRTDEAQLSSLNDPYYNTVNQYKRQNRFSILNNVGVTWDIIKGLSYQLKGSYGYEFNYTDQVWLNKTGESSSNGGQPVGKRSDDKAERWSIQNTLSYRFQLKKNRLDLLAGHEMNSNYSNNMTSLSKYYPLDFTVSDVLSMWDYGEAQPTYTTLGEPSRTASYFGRLNYSYDNRYFLTLNARADGTNVFAPENRWGFFPGMALAWRISEEKFMKSVRWMDNLKLRLSYGAVGNARVRSYWRQDYNVESRPNMLYYPNESVKSGLKLQNTLRNENLTWETKLSTNVGLDASFFKSRLNVTLEFYNDITKDLILRMDMPSNSGYEYQYQNVGRTRNRGVELTLDGTIINNKHFFLGANFNISFNRNTVEKLDGTATELIAQSGWRPDIGADDYRAIVGKSLGQIYGFEVDGFYTFDDFTFNPATQKWDLNKGVPDSRDLFSVSDNFGPGFIKLKDLNNDGVIDADHDRKVIGSALPKHFGGFGLNAAWKGFDMSAMFNWSYGGEVYNATKIMASTYTNRKYNNLSEIMKLSNRWTIIDPETGKNVMYGIDANPSRFCELNTKASIWSPMIGRNILTDWAVEDASFLRFSNLTLGYTLPAVLSGKLGIRKMRVYATASNLFCWTAYSGQDPEVNTQRSTLTPGVDYSAYPKARTYVFGVNLTF